MAPEMRVRWIHLVLLVLLGVSGLIPASPVAAAPADDPLQIPSLDNFRAAVMTGNRKVLVGVYVDGLFALPVVQQTCSMCISRTDDTITQFAWAAKYGVKGLIAHDYLSGQRFYGLQPGQRIELIYGDGRIEYYWITWMRRYRNTMPGSTETGFVSLTTGRSYSVEAMFRRVYMGSGKVTFQTCIAADGNLSWGTFFASAERNPVPLRRSLREAMLPFSPWLVGGTQQFPL